MLKNFHIVKALFKDQIHERYVFALNYHGNNYQGIYHEGEISWFNPQPLNNVKKKHIDEVELKINDKMKRLLS